MLLGAFPYLLQYIVLELFAVGVSYITTQLFLRTD